MTLSIRRKNPEHSPESLTIRTTYGPVTNEVDEHVNHLRSFWHDLGRYLDIVDGELKAKAEAEAAEAAELAAKNAIQALHE
jgi:hypothetical protein